MKAFDRTVITNGPREAGEAVRTRDELRTGIDRLRSCATTEPSVEPGLEPDPDLRDRRDEVFLYRTLARLRTDAPVGETSVDELRWRGAPRARWQAFCDEIGLARLRSRPHRWLADD